VSLLDTGTDEMLVEAEVVRTDDRRNRVRVPSGTPVAVRGRLQPISSEESATLGQEVATVYRFVCRTFPGGPWASVSGAGREWDVIGEPSVYTGSPRVAHTSVLLRARAPKEVPNG
jgi:hypothetical protein